MNSDHELEKKMNLDLVDKQRGEQDQELEKEMNLDISLQRI